MPEISKTAKIAFIAVDNNIWLIKIGASRHMIGDHDNLTSLMEKRLTQKVELGDNKNYAMKGIGTTSIDIDR